MTGSRPPTTRRRGNQEVQKARTTSATPVTAGIRFGSVEKPKERMNAPAQDHHLHNAEDHDNETRPQPTTGAVRAADYRSSRSALSAAWTACHISWKIGAIITGLVALGATTSPSVPVASGLATAVLVCAAVVDLHQRRLPNTIVLVAAAVFLLAIAFETVSGTPVRPAHLLVGAAAISGPLLCLHLISPTAMGFGDVKAGVVLGAAVGAVDWQLAVATLAIASGVTATVGLMARARTVAFGPGLVAATAIALAANTLLLPQHISPADSTSDGHDAHVWSPTP